VIAQVGRATAHQIARMSQRPTGLVALNDLMAMGLMAGLRECALSVPQDVSIVGIDGMPVAGLTNPALTTVVLPVREMAQAMVARALSRERGRKDVVFPPSLLRRESVAAPPPRQRSAQLPRAEKLLS
jgi:DNA-binding LacI/PurR family transcriptional regulator